LAARGKILVTGSSGLIGVALVSKLQRDGWGTIGMDVRGPAELSIDIRNSTEFISELDLAGVVHLAAMSRVADGQERPHLCRSINIDGTQAVLAGALSNRKRPWLIYASSREVYGQQEILPVSEEASLHPMNAYGHSKAAGETKVLDAQASGLNASIVRFSNVYGSVFDYRDRVVPAFAAAAAWGGALRLEGADTTFDFTHVDDVVDALIRIVSILDSDRQIPGPINLVSGQPTTLGALASLALELGLGNTHIIEGPARPFAVSRFWGNPAKAERVLSWKTKTEIHTGFSKLVVEFRSSSGFANKTGDLTSA
jgi:nucleoside-diphosphate-sugar epimerase